MGFEVGVYSGIHVLALNSEKCKKKENTSPVGNVQQGTKSLSSQESWVVARYILRDAEEVVLGSNVVVHWKRQSPQINNNKKQTNIETKSKFRGL